MLAVSAPGSRSGAVESDRGGAHHCGFSLHSLQLHLRSGRRVQVASVAKMQAKTARELAESSDVRLDRERADQTRRKVAQYSEPLVRAAYDLQARICTTLSARATYRIYTVSASPRRLTPSQIHSSYSLNTCPGLRSYGKRQSCSIWLILIMIVHWRQFTSNRWYPVRRRRPREPGLPHIPWSTKGDRGIALRLVRRWPRADMPRICGFHTKLRDDADFAHWFAPLERDVRKLMAGQSVNVQRLRDLQAALIDLIELIDEPQCRFDRNYLERQLTRRDARAAMQFEGTPRRRPPRPHKPSSTSPGSS